MHLSHFTPWSRLPTHPCFEQLAMLRRCFGPGTGTCPHSSPEGDTGDEPVAHPRFLSARPLGPDREDVTPYQTDGQPTSSTSTKHLLLETARHPSSDLTAGLSLTLSLSSMTVQMASRQWQRAGFFCSSHTIRDNVMRSRSRLRITTEWEVAIVRYSGLGTPQTVLNRSTVADTEPMHPGR